MIAYPAKPTNPAEMMPKKPPAPSGAAARDGKAGGLTMTPKGLAVAAAGCMLAGAGLFELISRELPNNTTLDGVTVQSEPSALSIRSMAVFVDCFLTLNHKFTAPAKLAAGETQIPWSRFVSEREVRFDPAVDKPDTLKIDCSNPVPGSGSFRLTR
jgi:hypothetical protein